jgi:hypothetical protein
MQIKGSTYAIFDTHHILPECYQILKKKGWKGLVGHPHDRGRCFGV